MKTWSYRVENVEWIRRQCYMLRGTSEELLESITCENGIRGIHEARTVFFAPLVKSLS